MSFRFFIYWCALCGGWAALGGWLLGRLGGVADPVGSAGIKGMCLGMLVALALGLVDALWVYSLRQVAQVVPRVLACTTIGTIGGLVGGVAGQALYDRASFSVFFVLGWAVTGLLVGASLGAFDFLWRFVRQEDMRGALRKIVRGVLGGTLGGALGGFLSLVLKGGWGVIFRHKPIDQLYSPSATGFVALGLCIGLMIGLAQVVFREAWLRVEEGFRAGREMILSKPVLTIGRAEACDIGLFGDPAVERLHARIVQQENRYLVADAGSAGGTYVNNLRISEPTLLRAGDSIRVGRNVLRFGERQKDRN
ncbi:MAG TPA: FHA domain-containing protein [Gemmataceae bacterium]|nr:FHA domain-containing protein [Gemmataceae bacterium]